MSRIPSLGGPENTVGRDGNTLRKGVVGLQGLNQEILAVAGVDPASDLREFTLSRFNDALEASLDYTRRIQTRPDTDSTSTRFDQFIHEHWKDWDLQLSGMKVQVGSRKRGGKRYALLELFLQHVKKFNDAELSLTSTLTPTLDNFDRKRLNSGKAVTGGLSLERLQDIFDSVGFDTNGLVLDHAVSKACQDLLNAHFKATPRCQSRLNLMEHQAFLSTLDRSNSSIQVTLSMAERCYVAWCVGHTHTLSAQGEVLLAEVIESLGGGAVTARLLPELSPEAVGSFSSAWKVLPEPSARGDAAACTPAGSWFSTRAIPLPPLHGHAVMASAWIATLQGIKATSATGLPQIVVPELAEAQSLAWALYETAGRPSVSWTLDQAQVVSEVMVLNLLRPAVPLAEVALAASVLSKIGIPWLPPAVGCVPVHLAENLAIIIQQTAGWPVLPPSTTDPDEA